MDRAASSLQSVRVGLECHVPVVRAAGASELHLWSGQINLIGWRLADLWRLTLECTSNPCQNGGLCADMPAGYACKCARGYIGGNCETDEDECASGPCSAAGTCIDELVQTLRFHCKTSA